MEVSTIEKGEVLIDVNDGFDIKKVRVECRGKVMTVDKNAKCFLFFIYDFESGLRLTSVTVLKRSNCEKFTQEDAVGFLLDELKESGHQLCSFGTIV